MIIAYYESNQTAEVAGVFETEEDYMEALPYLEAKAAEYRMRVTESVID
jgi:hypothetical protein